MAKAPTFKYTVTVEITAATEIKAKTLKRAVQNEISHVPVWFVDATGVKIGKVTVVAQ